jgi:glycolate oxidase FAD binding subunit
MSLTDLLQREFGASVDVRPGATDDILDSVAPAAVAAPLDEEAALALVAWCGRRDVAFVPFGGRTQSHIGAPPTRCELLIDTSRLAQVWEHDEGNATVEVGAGLRRAALEESIAATGQSVPIAPPSTWEWEEDAQARSTIGGLVSTARGSARAAKHGSVRDNVLGVRAALSDGREVRGGGKVVKNVSGYDLPKLFVGAHGTLGLVTRVTLRLRARPPALAEHVINMESIEEAERLRRVVAQGPFEPTSIEALWRNSICTLRLVFEGSEASVTSQAARLPGGTTRELPSLDGAFQQKAGRASPPLVLAARVPVAGAASWVARALAEGAEDVWWDASSGFVRACLPIFEASRVESLRSQAQEQGGWVVVERAPAQCKSAELVWGAPRPEQRLARKVKEAFDPSGVCSPGRV